MRCAGVLLTGGRSRRFGSDKATALFGHVTLAAAAGRALAAAADPVIEVGPGRSGLPFLRDGGSGPLAALTTGLEALGLGAAEPGASATGAAAVLLLACDMPLVGTELLRWLGGHPASGSVVPLVGGIPQPLCARWSLAALRRVHGLVEAGERSFRPLLAGTDVTLVQPGEWVVAAGRAGASALDDADTPAALDRLRALLEAAPSP